MRDPSKTNQELREEISALKKRIKELERSERTGEGRQGGEALLEGYLDNAPDGIYVLDMKGNFLYINRRSEEIVDYNRDELIGKNFLKANLLTKKYKNKAARLFKASIRGELTGPDELELINKEGRIIPVEINTSMVQHIDQRIIIGFARDITERKKAEEAMKESEMKFRALFDSADDAIFIMKNYLVVDCNRKTLDMFCCDRQDIIGRAPMDFSPETQPDGLLSSKKGIEKMDMARKGVSQFFEWKHMRMDGTLFDAEVSLNNMELGGETYLHAIVRDTTERKRTEEALRESESKFRNMAEKSVVGIYLIQDGQFKYVNAKFAEIFGYRIEEIAGTMKTEDAIFPEDWPMVEENLRKRISGELESLNYEFRIVTKSKDVKHAVVYSSRTVYQGKPAVIGTLLDITERKNLETQLLQSQKIESIGILAGGVAHDFNNILTALMGYASLMQIKMGKENPLKLYVDQILSASRKGADLTQNLLTFSRQQPVALASLDINDTIKATKKLLKRLLTEDIELFTSLTRYDTIVMADRSQMDQILFNLVTNARDAMPEGGKLTIETSIVSINGKFIKTHGFGKPGRYVLINISDTGEGMDGAIREKIFNPFFTTKEIGKGTGLGLATVYGIVKQHNGYITVHSEPGHGTTFRVYLPTVRTKIDEKNDAAALITGGEETILIAEDNEEVRRFMREALQEYGYKTVEAADGEDAISKFKQHQGIDLIVVDSVMPKKNGREVYEDIHGIDPRTKVLFTSGYTKDVVFNKGIEEGKFNFISKPLSLNQLLQRVREVLDRQ